MSLFGKVAKIATGGIMGATLGSLGGLVRTAAPPQTNYMDAANKQGTANVEAARQTAQISNPNINTPFGSQTVSYGANGSPTLTQSYSPGVQSLIDRINSPLDTSGIPQSPINAGTTAQDAILSRLEPQIQRSRDQMASRLANQGIPIGSEAYNNDLKDQGQQENDLRIQAALQGLNLDQNAHNQAFQEQSYERGLPINELGALRSALGFQPYQGASVTPAPIFSAAQAQGQQATDIYNAQQASRSNMLGGLMGLGGTLGAASILSDRRAKTDIKRIGKTDSGLPVYTYKYKGDDTTHMGVMAQEVKKVEPEAVSMVEGGLMAVDYSKVH